MTSPRKSPFALSLMLATFFGACDESAQPPAEACTQQLASFNCPATYGQALAGMECGVYMTSGGAATNGVWVPTMSLVHCDSQQLDLFSYRSGAEVLCYYSRGGDRNLAGAVARDDTPSFCNDSSDVIIAGIGKDHPNGCAEVSAVEKALTCYDAGVPDAGAE